MSKPSTPAPADDRDEPVETPVEETVDDMSMEAMIRQLRVAVLVVGAVAIVTSLMFNWFIHMVNAGATDQLNMQYRRFEHIQKNYQHYQRVLQQLAEIALTKPAMEQVFNRHGYEIRPNRQPDPNAALPGPDPFRDSGDVFQKPPSVPPPPPAPSAPPPK
jgi:uncharacterized protein HemX